MSDSLTTSGVLSGLLSTYFVRVAMPRLTARAVLYGLAEKTPLPQGEGSTVKWNGFSNFGMVSAAIASEGDSPSLRAVCSRQASATVKQYARGVKITDFVEYTASLNVVTNTVENLADSAGKSVDKVILTAILKNSIERNSSSDTGSTNVLSAWMSNVASAFHAGSNNLVSVNGGWGFPVVLGTTATRLSAVGTVGVSSQMSLFALRKVVKKLQRKNAMEFADGQFKAVMNTDALHDLYGDVSWKQWYTLNDPTKMESEANKQEPTPQAKAVGINIYATNIMPQYRATHSCDVSFVFGQGAYGVTEFNTNGNKGFEIIQKRSGPNDTSNPMNLYQTVSYKFALAAAALNVSAGRVLITHAKA